MTTTDLSPMQADHILAALQLGVVPEHDLQRFAVGLDKQMLPVGKALNAVSAGGGRVKVIVGPYGSGKTFLVSLLAEQALSQDMAISRVQLDMTGTSLSQLDQIYKAIVHGLRVRGVSGPALQAILDQWVSSAERYVQDVLRLKDTDPRFPREVEQRITEQLGALGRELPALAVALRH